MIFRPKVAFGRLGRGLGFNIAGVPIIHVLLHRLGVIAGNHFNGPQRVTEGC